MLSKNSHLAYFLLILFSLSTGGVHAFTRGQKNCGELNPEMSQWFKNSLNKKNPVFDQAPIEKYLGPLKDQKVGWCFAYTAADMLSYASGHIISGAQVAKNYHAANLLNRFRTFLYQTDDGGDTKEALKASFNTPLCDERDFPSEIYNSYSKVKKKECRTPVTEITELKVRSFSATGFYDGHTLFSRIDEILKDGRIAGIEYDHEQIMRDKANDSEQTKPNHASSIIGRYFDKADSSCRYIIRNSFGRTCERLETKKTRCVNGYYSVTEEQLNRMLTKVISLERK